MLNNISKVKAGLLILLVFFGACLVFALWPDRNRMAIFGSRDYIEKGSKFGLKIGDDIKLAEFRLTSLGMKKGDNSYTRKYSENGLMMCHGKEFSDKYSIDLFLDKSWRKGTVCLASLEGKIVHVSWDYNMLNP